MTRKESASDVEDRERKIAEELQRIKIQVALLFFARAVEIGVLVSIAIIMREAL